MRVFITGCKGQLEVYIGFIVLEFWLFVGGAALLFVSPLWGGVVLGVAVALFLLAVLFGG